MTQNGSHLAEVEIRIRSHLKIFKKRSESIWR